MGSGRATNGFFLGWRLVVVGDFDFVGIPVLPRKAHPVLFVDPDAILPCSIAHQSFQTVTRRHRQFMKIPNTIELRQLSTCYGPRGSRTCSPSPAALDTVEKIRSGLIGERPYHAPYYNGLRNSVDTCVWLSNGARGRAGSR